MRQAGVEVTVYETYEDPVGEVGSFVSLATNGLRGLDVLGCLPEVHAAGVDIPRQRMWSAGGHLLGDVPRGRRRDDTLHSVTLMRGRLVAVLRDAALEVGAEIVTGERLTGVTETPDGVLAEFASGRRDTADLLVAADGIWSTVRGLIDPAAPRPEYAGLYAVSGISTMDDSKPSVEPGVFNMTFARNGAFIHLTAGDEVWWSAQIAEPDEPDRHDGSHEQWLRRTKELYAKEAVPSAVIAATTRLQPTVLFHAVDPVQTWHTSRVVLIGDAALQAATAITAALTAYDAERRPRIVKLLGAAEDNRGAKKAGPVKRRLQALLMRVFVPLLYEKATAWLYSHEPTHPLPDHTTARLREQAEGDAK